MNKFFDPHTIDLERKFMDLLFETLLEKDNYSNSIVKLGLEDELKPIDLQQRVLFSHAE